MQRGLGDSGLGGDLSEGLALGFEKPGVFDLFFGVGDGAADVSVVGFGDHIPAFLLPAGGKGAK